MEEETTYIDNDNIIIDTNRNYTRVDKLYLHEEDWNESGEELSKNSIVSQDSSIPEHEVFFDVIHFEKGWEERAQDIVDKQIGRQANQFSLQQYDTRAANNWDVFYTRNTTNFFKDRHYLLRAFPPLEQALEQTECIVLEIGCGVGNTIVPLTNKYPNCHGYGVDFAASAIKLLNDMQLPRCVGFVHDASTSDPLPKEIPQADIVTMIYVLSAIAPERMQQAVCGAIERLKPGGALCFRDYGYLDNAQLRFDPSQRLGLNYYVRQDGTRSFFFSLEGMRWLFEVECGLECVECKYIKRVVQNRKDGLRMRRVFVNAIYRKPL